MIPNAGKLYKKIRDQQLKIEKMKSDFSCLSNSYLTVVSDLKEKNARLDELRKVVEAIGNNIGKGKDQ